MSLEGSTVSGHDSLPPPPQKKVDAAFLLTIGSFLLTVELFYSQLTILAF